MAIHIHLFDCNCIFCGSDFPPAFFQTHNEDGINTQSATVPQDETDPQEETFDLDDDDWDDEDSDDDDEEDDEEDAEEDDEEDSDDEEEEPKPDKPNDKKKLFGFLIGKHDVCVL